jgi:hypothetical protein
MKNALKIALLVAALGWSANASAAGANWFDNMMQRLGVVSSSPGFCSANPNSWICWSAF